jgi:hypothetical protein
MYNISNLLNKFSTLYGQWTLSKTRLIMNKWNFIGPATLTLGSMK